MSHCDNLSTHSSVGCLPRQPKLQLPANEYYPNICKRTPSAFYFALTLENDRETNKDIRLSRADPLLSPIYMKPLKSPEVDSLDHSDDVEDMTPIQHDWTDSAYSLRRVPPSTPDLRNLAHHQSHPDPARPRSESGPRQTSTLLQVNSCKPQRHSFASIGDEELETQGRLPRRRAHDAPYQDLHIVSMYEESAFLSDLVSSKTGEEDVEETRRSSTISLADDSSSGSSSHSPRTPVPTGVPSQLTLPKTPDYGLQLTARKSHMRLESCSQQSDLDEQTDIDDGDTIEQSPIPVHFHRQRPRLVEISRYGLTDHEERFSPSHHADSGPSTPNRDLLEVSAFSPYDTPATSTPFSDLSRTASNATPTPRGPVKLSINTQLTMFQAASFESQRSSTDSYAYPVSDRRLAEPFESSFSQRSTAVSSTSSLNTSHLPSLSHTASDETKSSTTSSRLSFMFSPQSYELKLKRANSTTNGVFRTVAGQYFDLKAAEMAVYRPQRLDSGLESMLVSSLNGVFPQASPAQLSSLLAWLIVDLHYVKLFESAPTESVTVYGDRDSQDFRALSKSMHSASLIQGHWSDASHGSPTTKSAKGISISTPLSSTRIPSKAASVLGLGADSSKRRPTTSTQTSQKFSISSTEDEARAAQASARDMACTIIRKILVGTSLSISPLNARQKGLRAHIRGRSAAVPAVVDPQNDAFDRAVDGLWQACRCIVVAV